MTRRRLSDQEKALWDRIARTVVPLRPEPRVPAIKAEPSDVVAKPVEASPPAPPVPPSQPKARTVAARPSGDLDRKTRRKLAKGAVAIDARIDLHGMTQEEAHAALIRFVVHSVGLRRRVVLVITGKGLGEGEGRGVLRRNVPHWLVGRELGRHVVSFGSAHAAHGGDGALYVRLRPSKP